MRRSSPGILLALAVISVGVGFLLDQVLTAMGQPTFTPLVSLPVLLVGLGVVVIALAVPIYRRSRGHSALPINPFRALRIAVLARASAMLGAVGTGFGGGLIIFVLTRPVPPPLGSWSTQLATVVAGIVLVAAGLIAEHLCTIRKDDDDEQPGGTDPGVGAHSH